MTFVKLAYRLYAHLRQSLKKLGVDFLILRYPRDFEQDGLSTSRLRPFEADLNWLPVKKAVVAEIGSDYQIDWRTHVFLWAISSQVKKEGINVELGTGKGWMFFFASQYFTNFNADHETWLFDRFVPNSVDQVTGVVIPQTADEHYANGFEEVASRFSNSPRVNLVQGDLPKSLSQLPNVPVRFVHVDLNAAEPEVESLRLIWNRIVSGGLVLLDDFGQPEFIESNRLMREFAREKSCEILWLPTGQGLLIKG
jgi:O-methyltransferase